MIKKTIVLSGGITGVPNYRYHFSEAEKLLAKDPDVEWVVLNPCILPREGFTYEQYIIMTMAMVEASSTVFCLDGWEKSSGARGEHALAVQLGKDIIYQEGYIEHLGGRLAEIGFSED